MTTKVKFPGNTIQLSDTVDQWGRKVHINVRNDKVTLVYRWKAKSDNRAHTPTCDPRRCTGGSLAGIRGRGRNCGYW